jgi:hypothetical protein
MTLDALKAFACLLLLLSTGCSQQDPNAPYVEIAGGGFIFNYRIGEAHYGLVLRPKRPLPKGAVVEAVLENPAGGEPFRLTQTVRGGAPRLVFDSPPVQGVVKDRPYRVTVRVLDDGAELQRVETAFTSTLDQTVLPDRPLTVGPGYTRNDKGLTTAFPPEPAGGADRAADGQR